MPTKCLRVPTKCTYYLTTSVPSTKKSSHLLGGELELWVSSSPDLKLALLFPTIGEQSKGNCSCMSKLIQTVWVTMMFAIFTSHTHTHTLFFTHTSSLLCTCYTYTHIHTNPFDCRTHFPLCVCACVCVCVRALATGDEEMSGKAQTKRQYHFKGGLLEWQGSWAGLGNSVTKCLWLHRCLTFGRAWKRCPWTGYCEWIGSLCINWVAVYELGHCPWVKPLCVPMNWVTVYELGRCVWIESLWMNWVTAHELSRCVCPWIGSLWMDWVTVYEMGHWVWIGSLPMN